MLKCVINLNLPCRKYAEFNNFENRSQNLKLCHHQSQYNNKVKVYASHLWNGMVPGYISAQKQTNQWTEEVDQSTGPCKALISLTCSYTKYVTHFKNIYHFQHLRDRTSVMPNILREVLPEVYYAINGAHTEN
jgi:hypothetical protein